MEEKKSRRGFTDSRARRLTANAVVVGLVAALLMLLLVSYWAVASRLDTYGWGLAAIVGGLASISMMCIVAAYRVQLATDRKYESAEAVESGFDGGPVEADPPPAPAAIWRVPVTPTPSPAAARIPAVRRPAIPAIVIVEDEHFPEDAFGAGPTRERRPEPQPAPAEVTEPAHH